MLPDELEAGQFNRYPPEARQLAVKQLNLLRQLPLSFAPLLLQQVREYDWRFPAERKDIDRQFTYLGSLSPAQLEQAVAGFAQLNLEPSLGRMDWVNDPGRFSERLAAYLWSTHQIDSFRAAAIKLVQAVDAALPQEPPPIPRTAIVVIGQGVEENKYPLFRKLRPHGVYFTNVKTGETAQTLLDAVAARASTHPVPFGHWYIEGAGLSPVPEGTQGGTLTCVAYDALKPVRAALLKKIEKAINGGISGPEALRTMLHEMRPEEIGLSGAPGDVVLSRFQTSVLTEGSGTQIFSTTFVQWAAREAWRRAQPVTLFAHFAPRQRERPMNEMLSGKVLNPEPDPVGSLIDADMGAYYTWIDQQRLAGAGKASFLVWFENHNEALAIAPSLPRDTQSATPVDLKWLASQVV
ncbi:MAG: hypothetical protein ACRD2G_11575 [Terriglobia bacterium]